jgi:hypothetical protein
MMGLLGMFYVIEQRSPDTSSAKRFRYAAGGDQICKVSSGWLACFHVLSTRGCWGSVEMGAASDAFDRLAKDHPEASEAEIKKLFIAAVKGDPALAKAIAIEVRRAMFVFDPDRAATVIDLIIRNDPAADDAFVSLLREMRHR